MLNTFVALSLSCNKQIEFSNSASFSRYFFKWSVYCLLLGLNIELNEDALKYVIPCQDKSFGCGANIMFQSVHNTVADWCQIKRRNNWK